MFSSVLSFGLFLAFYDCVSKAAEATNLCEHKIPEDEDVEDNDKEDKKH